MKAGRVRTTMQEECEEILHFVRDAHAHEQRGASQGISLDDARTAACNHLRRAALRAIWMDRDEPVLMPDLGSYAVN